MAQRPNRSAEIERHAAKLEKDPQSRVFAQLADAYRKEGLLEEAIRICRDGLVAHPTYASARVVLARALLEQGALEEAEAEFRRVLELAADNLVALRLLGDICGQQGRPGEARQLYERALRLNPLDRETQDRLAALPGEAGPPSTASAASPAVPLGPEGFEPAEATGPAAGHEVSLGEQGEAEPGEGAGEPEDRSPGTDSPEAWRPAVASQPDPLASKTLAGLYASQGHADVAASIYSQLERQAEPEVTPAAPRAGPPRAAPDPTLVERLLSLREAARRRRRPVERNDR